MRLELSERSRVLIDLRATGLLRAVGHDPTLAAHPDAAAFALDGPIDLVFRVARIDLPADLSAADQRRMRDNLDEVLGADRFPDVRVHARFDGTPEGGRLAGDLHLRGAARPFALDVRALPDADAGWLAVTGTWEGTLTQLGVKPFKALLGTLRLADWIRLRVDARVSHRAA